MIDLEFRSQATPPEKCLALPFREVGDSVLYHSLPGLGSGERFGGRSEMAVTRQIQRLPFTWPPIAWRWRPWASSRCG